MGSVIPEHRARGGMRPKVEHAVLYRLPAGVYTCSMHHAPIPTCSRTLQRCAGCGSGRPRGQSSLMVWRHAGIVSEHPRSGGRGRARAARLRRRQSPETEFTHPQANNAVPRRRGDLAEHHRFSAPERPYDAVHVANFAMQRAPDQFWSEMAQVEDRSRGLRQRARRLHRARAIIIFGKDVRFNRRASTGSPK